jgi:hypothetical protein
MKIGRTIAAVILMMLMMETKAEQVRGYQRKDGTQVSSYDRNPSRAVVPFPASSPAVLAAPLDSSTNGSEEDSPKISTSTIISNSWVSDTLNVYGSLTNLNVTLKIIGFDENRQVITESSDYVIESTGIFHAKLRDAKKQIRFLKVLLTGKVTDIPQRVPVVAVGVPVVTVGLQRASNVPFASVPPSATSSGSRFTAIVIGAIIIATLWLVGKPFFPLLMSPINLFLYPRPRQANRSTRN